MHHSSALLTLLTLSATLSLAGQAQAETPAPQETRVTPTLNRIAGDDPDPEKVESTKDEPRGDLRPWSRDPFSIPRAAIAPTPPVFTPVLRDSGDLFPAEPPRRDTPAEADFEVLPEPSPEVGVPEAQPPGDTKAEEPLTAGRVAAAPAPLPVIPPVPVAQAPTATPDVALDLAQPQPLPTPGDDTGVPVEIALPTRPSTDEETLLLAPLPGEEPLGGDPPPANRQQLAQEGAPLPSPDPQPSPSTEEPQVLVAEVLVTGLEGEALEAELEDRVFGAIATRPGFTTTRTQLQRDINSIFATGVFANVRAVPEDTPLGVRITFLAQPNPILSRVEVTGGEVLPEAEITRIFSPQYGRIVNLIEFQRSVAELNRWYQDNGYVLAQVVAAPEISPDGVVTLSVAEGVIESIRIRFQNEEGAFENEDGTPIRGRTRDFIITRQLTVAPGDVFRQEVIQQDLQRVFGLGLFEDLQLTLAPGETNPRQVDLTINVVERNTGSVGAGVGFNFTGDVFGTLSYRQDNFGGNQQRLSAETQLSSRDLLFDISFTDPWIATDPNRTSYSVNAFARRAIPLTFDNGPIQVNLPNGDRVRTTRFGGGISFQRPFSGGWEGSLGTSFQRVQTTDGIGRINTVDAQGRPLSASGTGIDDLWLVQLGVARDTRDSATTPTQGSVLRFGTEQSIPVGSGNILLNRLRASYSHYVPVQFLNFSEGPQALAFNIQGGTVVGTLPPYEAFALGGTNSVRGYDEGALGAGRSFLQGTVEYRFPLFSFLGGALFADFATDLGSASGVPGNPGATRGKPGNGFGYGVGLRIQTPLGPIRLDYGISNEGRGRIHFGIGERF